MNQNYSISVIIPAYNASKSIIEAIESVISQTYKTNYEIIIINDGSTDNTPELVTKYSDIHNYTNIKLITQKNKGVAAARNTGMKNATNKWIAFLDSDDRWLPTKIEEQIKCIQNNPNIDFIGTEKLGHTTRILWKTKTGLSKISLKEQFIKWYPPTSTYLFKTEIINKIGYMDENLRYGEDDEFLIRILNEYSGWFLAKPLVEYDHGKPGFGHSGLSKNLKKMQIGQRCVITRAKEKKILSNFEYILARVYSEIKYLRRIIKTMI